MKRTSQTLFLVVLLTVIMVGCVAIQQPQTVPEVAQTQFLTPPDDVRDYRYCEIIPVFRERATMHLEVYNTIGLNDCPTELWNELAAETLVDAYDAAAVIMNGPRYWVLNGITGGGETAKGKIVDFNGIEMKLVAKIETKVWEGTLGDEPYTDNEVRRTTTFLYKAGNMVYELTSPEGEVYRMQSYTQIIDPTLTIDDLETLGERLDLPAGWRYQARVLTEDSLLTADGLAFVINDNLGNSYQKIPLSQTAWWSVLLSWSGQQSL
ncbi:MAG: hypothetical protein AAF639_20620 [Chloroflexota bacterium]